MLSDRLSGQWRDEFAVFPILAPVVVNCELSNLTRDNSVFTAPKVNYSV